MRQRKGTQTEALTCQTQLIPRFMLKLPATCGFACEDKMINFHSFFLSAAWMSNG